MMAAIAITKPTEMKEKFRANAPETGGVRHSCPTIDMTEYSTLSMQEQMEISTLQEDIIGLWETNRELAEKLKSMNDEETKMKKMNSEMEDFFSNIPLDNLIATIGTQTDIEETDPNVWKEKERRLQYEVIQHQKELLADFRSKQAVVPKGLWGHKSRTWPRSQNKNSGTVKKTIFKEAFTAIIQSILHSLLPKTIAPDGQESLPEAPT